VDVVCLDPRPERENKNEEVKEEEEEKDELNATFLNQ
jgi:hypothetical protein